MTQKKNYKFDLIIKNSKIYFTENITRTKDAKVKYMILKRCLDQIFKIQIQMSILLTKYLTRRVHLHGNLNILNRV